MFFIISTFTMIVAIGVVAIIKLEDEKRIEQFERIKNRPNARFID